MPRAFSAEKERTTVLAQRITDRRIALRWRQRDLAAATGVAQTQVAQWETLGITPTLEHLVGVADALDVSTDWLLGRTSDPTAPVRDTEAVVAS